MGRAFINECLRRKDDGSPVYWWSQYILKTRRLDGTEDESVVQKYGFRTSAQSKELIIREYRNALNNQEIDVTEETYREMQTYVYDRNNSANAVPPNHDDRIMGDMIAYHGILHEIFVVEYDSLPVDEEELTPFQRHLHRLKSGTLNKGESNDDY